jgi:hypothetical protein
MTDEEPDQEQLEAQMETAVDAIREAVMRLLREGEVHPQIIVMAATRVAGGLGAAAALATGQDVEGVLGDLAEALRQAGRDHYETLRAELETLPVLGTPERARCRPPRASAWWPARPIRKRHDAGSGHRPRHHAWAGVAPYISRLHWQRRGPSPVGPE